MIPCPWCGYVQFEMFYSGAEAEIACGAGFVSTTLQVSGGCKRPISVALHENGRVKHIRRSVINYNNNEIDISTRDMANNHSVNIGTVNGPVAFGGDAMTVTNVYNETVKMIDQASNIDQQKKTDAKGALAYFKTHAPTVLPIAAEIIKKTLGL